MKLRLLLTCTGLVFSALNSQLSIALAQGTACTYQGRLNDGSSPANGSYDLTFALFGAGSGGAVLAGPLTNSATAVSNGLFTVTLDFGAGVFSGAARWLEIGVRTNGGGAFATLAPRQALTPSPYAIYAGNASVVAAGSVVQSLNTLKDDVRLAAGTNVTITPSGNTLTIAAAGVGGSGIWSVLNNNAYYNAGNVGIGTANPLEKLTLAGVTSFNTGLKVTGSSPNGTGIALENTAPGGHKFDLFSGGANDGIGAGAFGLYDETAAGYRLAIATNGNIGIGTANPQTTLDIVSAQHALTMTANGPDVTFKDTAHANARGVIQSVNGEMNFFTESYLSGTNPFSLLTLKNNGNVGIGNPQPQMTLDIVSAQHAIAMTGYGPDVTFYDTAHANARDVIQSVNGDLNFFTESYMSGQNPSALLKLANTGNVGVGTATPTEAKLQVNDTTVGTAVYGVSSIGSGVVGESSSPGSSGVFGRNTGSGYAVYANGNAGQDRDKGGFVKAMAKINADGSVAQSYSALGGQITASGGNGGYVVVFPFQINDRFISVTPFENGTYGAVVANILSFPDATSVWINIWTRDHRSGFDAPVSDIFYIYVY